MHNASRISKSSWSLQHALWTSGVCRRTFIYACQSDMPIFIGNNGRNQVGSRSQPQLPHDVRTVSSSQTVNEFSFCTQQLLLPRLLSPPSTPLVREISQVRQNLPHCRQRRALHSLPPGHQPRPQRKQRQRLLLQSRNPTMASTRTPFQ